MVADAEVQANAEKFRASLGPKLAGNVAQIIGSDSSKLDDAYARLTTLQAWRSYVLEEHISLTSLGFYAEAQNDGLTSLVLISSGLWRSGMKSLRSLVENVVQCMYYMDHPVEYRNWDEARHRPTFRELFEYLADHPDIRGIPDGLKPGIALKNQYSYLSKIVHASAREFRMTNNVESSSLWKTTPDGIGQWATAQKSVIRDINFLMLALFKRHLQGAANKGLREAISLVVPAAKDTVIKSSLGIKLIRKAK